MIMDCYMEKFDDSPVCCLISSKILHEMLGKDLFLHINFIKTGPPMSKYPKPSLCALRIGGSQDLPLVERSSRADEPANHSPVHRAGIATASLKTQYQEETSSVNIVLSLILCPKLYVSFRDVPSPIKLVFPITYIHS